MPNVAIEYDKETLREFCRRWRVTEFSLFGSAVREDFAPESDVDVLVTLAPDAPWTLSNWLEMQRELERLFHRRVDLIERAAVEHSENRFRKRAILSSAVMLDVA
jgi:uncharacterized protein